MAEEQNWLTEELKELEQNSFEGQALPALKLEEGKITVFEVDFSKPFDKWTDPKGVVKKILPVIHNGEKKVFWVNTRNPKYREIIDEGTKGVTLFKVFRTGQKQDTRYNLIKE